MLLKDHTRTRIGIHELQLKGFGDLKGVDEIKSFNFNGVELLPALEWCIEHYLKIDMMELLEEKKKEWGRPDLMGCTHGYEMHIGEKAPGASRSCFIADFSLNVRDEPMSGCLSDAASYYRGQMELIESYSRPTPDGINKELVVVNRSAFPEHQMKLDKPLDGHTHLGIWPVQVWINTVKEFDKHFRLKRISKAVA